MTLLLSISDNLDGTGGTATIAGADAATPVTVYYQPLSVLESNTAWTLSGTRSGSGSLTVTGTGVGSYFWTAAGTVSGAGVYTPPFAQALTNAGATSIHYACLVALQMRIQALNLFGALGGSTSPAERVQVCWAAYEAVTAVLVRPGVALFPWLSEGQPGIMSGTDDIEYPVAAVLLDNYEGPVANLERNLLWRQQIFQALRHKRLPGVPSTITTPVAPQQIFIEELAKVKGLNYSALLLRPTSREVRPR